MAANAESDTPYPADVTTVEGWCDAHGVLLPLTPFAYRDVDIFEFATEFREGIDALPATAATFSLSDLTDHPKRASLMSPPMLHALGAWRLPNDGSGPARWVNPSYVHQDALADIPTDQRLEHCQRCLSFGTVTQHDLAPRFGISHPGLRQWLSRRLDWKAEREAGKRRLARTLRTAVEWGHDVDTVTSIWPQETSTVRTWMYDYAPASEFEPPADPSFEQGFQQFRDGGDA